MPDLQAHPRSGNFHSQPEFVPVGRDVGIVIGCGDIASAVAHAMHRRGLAVVVSDATDPSWPRRGMSYTNAWYVGNSELDAAPACFCASLRSVPSVLQRGLIVATTWSWPALAQALHPAVVVDARARPTAASKPLLDYSRLTIGVGRGLTGGVDAHVVIDTGDPAGDGDAYVVQASQAGRFMTTHRIGQRVRAGDVVGQIGVQAVVAGGHGVLRGLSARGARIAPGDVVLEIDPRGDPALCFGIAANARRIASDVMTLVDDTVAAH